MRYWKIRQRTWSLKSRPENAVLKNSIEISGVVFERKCNLEKHCVHKWNNDTHWMVNYWQSKRNQWHYGSEPFRRMAPLSPFQSIIYKIKRKAKMLSCFNLVHSILLYFSSSKSWPFLSSITSQKHERSIFSKWRRNAQ